MGSSNIVGLGDTLDSRTLMDSNSDSDRCSSGNEVHQIMKPDQIRAPGGNGLRHQGDHDASADQFFYIIKFR